MTTTDPRGEKESPVPNAILTGPSDASTGSRTHLQRWSLELTTSGRSAGCAPVGSETTAGARRPVSAWLLVVASLLTIGLAHVARASASHPMPPIAMQVETYASIDVAGTVVELWRGRDDHGWLAAALRLTGDDGSTVTLRAADVWQLRDGVSDDVDTLSVSALSDVTGNGVPDLVIGTYANGMSCCFGLYVFELGEEPRVLVSRPAHHGALDDLTGDGRLELLDGFGYTNLCATGIGGPYAAARYDATIGAYRLASAELLAGSESITTTFAELSDRVRSSAAMQRDAYEIACRIAYEAVPPIIAGLVDPDAVRTLLDEPAVRDVLPGEDFTEYLIANALAHPMAFLPDTAPRQRVVSPDQLAWRSCNALHHMLEALTTRVDGLSEAERAVSSANRRLIAAYVARIGCDGPELTSLALRNGIVDERCLRVSPGWERECEGLAITVHAQAAVDAVAAEFGSDAVRDADDLWLAAYDDCPYAYACAGHASAALWVAMVDRLTRAREQ